MRTVEVAGRVSWKPVMHSHPSTTDRPASITKQSLSPNQRRFVALLQEVRYGHVHRVAVRRGEPDFRDGIRYTRTVKVLGDNQPHPHGQIADYVLRREFVAFFQLLSAIGKGEIINLDVRDGLPFDFQVEGSSSH